MKKNRPWKKHASITRTESNSGDVKYTASHPPSASDDPGVASFENLDEAEASLDAWWAHWYPLQIKSSRPA